MSDFLLELRNINKSYNIQTVLEDFSLSVKKSQTVAIVGPSGSGKSTLLHIIGLLDQAESGEILFEGKEVSRYSDSERTKFRSDNIGFVYQFHYLINELTVYDNVALAYFVKFGTKEGASVLDLLDKLNIYGKKDSYPYQLSGGEKQRTAIARALITSPKLLLADEPTGNLDKENAKRVKNDFFNITKSIGTSLILTTHDADFAKSCENTISLP